MGANQYQPLNPRVSILSIVTVYQDRKLLEREERAREGQRELEQMQAYNPFGRAGAGAPPQGLSPTRVSQQAPAKITSYESVDQKEDR